jgi:hypothetical protein
LVIIIFKYNKYHKTERSTGNGKKFITATILYNVYMKKFLIIFSLIFAFGCSSYSQNKKTIYDCKIKDTIFEVEKYLGEDKYSDELNKEGSIEYLLNDSIEISISIYKNDGIITKRILNKKTNIVKVIDYDNTTKRAISKRYYYEKGKFAIGKEFSYDTLGKIIKTINNDDPQNYTLCYKEAEAIVMKKVGKKYEIENINRREETINNQKVYLWSVIATIIGSRKYSDSKNFWIDGKTGKIIKILKLRVSTDDYFKE